MSLPTVLAPDAPFALTTGEEKRITDILNTVNDLIQKTPPENRVDLFVTVPFIIDSTEQYFIRKALTDSGWTVQIIIADRPGASETEIRFTKP